MMLPGCEHLKLGKSSAFVKRDLRLLPLTDAEFETDFFLDRGASTSRRAVWRGMVVERECGAFLAMEDAEWPPADGCNSDRTWPRQTPLPRWVPKNVAKTRA